MTAGLNYCGKHLHQHLGVANLGVVERGRADPQEIETDLLESGHRGNGKPLLTGLWPKREA